MATVKVKIPGIGEVEAKNAATEATLLKIAALMGSIDDNTKQATEAGGGTSKLQQSFTAISVGFKVLKARAEFVSDTFRNLNNITTGVIKGFADVGDNIESAARVIPILAPLLTAVAGSSVKLNSALLDAAKSGAGFGGSVTDFARAAAESGVTLEKFGQFLSKNGEALLGFGTTTEEGAGRFTQVSKALRAASSDLYALGFTTDDINQGLANYGDLLRKQGLQGTKSNAELVAGAKNYLKEIDALAKITGEERSVKEAQMKALATDAQFQMALAGKSAETRESFMKLIGGFGPTLGGFVKDFISTGSLTTAANEKIAAALGGDVLNELNGLRQKMLNNEQLTAAEQDRLRAIIKKASEQQSKALGTSLAASRENDDMSKALIEGQQLNLDAVKNATEEQKKAAKFGDGFNKRIQEMQQRLAQLSTQFTAILADSKILDVLMGAFNILATLTKAFIVPAFQLMTTVISTVAGILGEYLYPAFLQLTAAFQTQVLPIISSVAETIGSIVKPAFEGLGTIVNDYIVPAFKTVGGFILDNLTPIMAGLAASLVYFNAQAIAGAASMAMQKAGALAATVAEAAKTAATFLATASLTALAGAAFAAALPFLKIAIPILALVGIFKLLYDNGFTFSNALEGFTDAMLRLLNRVTLGKMGISEEEYKTRQQNREAERERLAEERKNGKDRKDREAAAAKLDEKIMGGKSKYAKTIEDSNKKIDYSSNNAEANLKKFATAEGSPLLPKEAAAKADATRKEMEKKDEAAKTEADKAKEAEKKAEGTKASGTQESAESLLSNLNTKMDQLIKLSAQTTTNTYQQVVATRSLSQDLYQGLPS